MDQQFNQVNPQNTSSIFLARVSIFTRSSISHSNSQIHQNSSNPNTKSLLNKFPKTPNRIIPNPRTISELRPSTMAKDDELAAAKKAYRSAKEVGNRREEARWANVIGDILKNRGEYVEALKWLRIDFKISSEYLLEKDLLPTCQSIGELYLRLQDFENALYYQKEHLRLAKEASDLVEQQRATTQLGRTYHEMFSKSETNHSALHNAKKYFKSAMSLAKTLKENPPNPNSSFLKEYIDAHNNAGMLEMDLDNLEEAEKILKRGLEICDEEEVSACDDGRSRLHHNLGFVYTQLRMWKKAREHMKQDIMICKNIGHLQGEAKGYNNLGELYVQVQKFQEAKCSYQKALELASSLEDEYALAGQIEQNIRVVDEYVKVMEDMKQEEQNLKKLKRRMAKATGASSKRKCLKLQMASLDRLIDKTIVVSAWPKHREFAKMKKRLATTLCDKEKLGDSFLVVGESYQKLREFQKAQKWYNKSLDIYKRIGNLEGQAIVKINMGDVLDSEGDWVAALKTFEEGYRIAVQAKKIHIQILALENMHYSNMMRFDNVEEARRLQLQIDNLKALASSEQEAYAALKDSCSETDTEGDNSFSRNSSNASGSSQSSESHHMGKPISSIEVEDCQVVSSPLHPCSKLQKPETEGERRIKRSSGTSDVSPKSFSKSLGSPASVSRKRVRLVLSDDEDDAECGNRRLHPVEDIATSNEFKGVSELHDVARGLWNNKQDAYKDDISFGNAVNFEESSCSHKSNTLEEAAVMRLKSSDNNERCIRMKVENVTVCVEMESCTPGDELDMEALKVQAACSYYLQLSPEKRSSGLLPIIGRLKLREQVLASANVKTITTDALAGDWIEASISGRVQKRLIKTYIDCCQKLSEPPNMKLLMKLYNLEVSEDEVIVSDCELQDMSVVPLLDALQAHKTISMLDLSHNMLGNATMEKLQQVFTLLGQKYGSLVLDLHSNMFGPTALFQICECPVLLSRLEVLNISGNRLTDACGTYLSGVLRNCKALYSLNIERCSLTSRTVQTIADALNSVSVLSHLSIGYNNPISGSSLSNLVRKLAALERFSELSLNGLKLNKPALDSVCQLAKSSCLSGLMLGATNIGCDGALQLTESLFHDTQELVKLDLSYCGLTHKFFDGLRAHASAVCNIIELNLDGNPIMPEGGSTLAALLANPDSSMKVLRLNKCHLGLSGVTQILKSLAENESLEELHLAENIQQEQQPNNDKLECHSTEPKPVPSSTTGRQGQEDDLDLDNLEAADSFDSTVRAKCQESALDDTCTSQGKTNATTTEPQTRPLDDLAAAIGNLKQQLQLLDLSDNGLSDEAADTVFKAWCSGKSRAGMAASRHVKGQMLHLFVQGKRCCGIKPCCKRD